jgi:hypothetical protein
VHRVRILQERSEERAADVVHPDRGGLQIEVQQRCRVELAEQRLGLEVVQTPQRTDGGHRHRAIVDEDRQFDAAQPVRGLQHVEADADGGRNRVMPRGRTGPVERDRAAPVERAVDEREGAGNRVAAFRP